MEKYI